MMMLTGPSLRTRPFAYYGIPYIPSMVCKGAGPHDAGPQTRQDQSQLAISHDIQLLSFLTEYSKSGSSGGGTRGHMGYMPHQSCLSSPPPTKKLR